MKISKAKQDSLVDQIGTDATMDVLGRLAEIEVNLKAATVGSYQGTVEENDVLAETLVGIDAGRISFSKVRKLLGDPTANALGRASLRKGLKVHSKDIPHSLGEKSVSLEEISASIAKATELVEKLDADAQEEAKDASPVARYAQMLTGSKGKATDLIDEKDTDPIAKHVKALAEGRVEQGG